MTVIYAAAYLKKLIRLLCIPCSNKNCWKSKLGKFKNDQKYFAKQTGKFWKPQKVIAGEEEKKKLFYLRVFFSSDQ